MNHHESLQSSFNLPEILDKIYLQKIFIIRTLNSKQLAIHLESQVYSSTQDKAENSYHIFVQDTGFDITLQQTIRAGSILLIV